MVNLPWQKPSLCEIVLVASWKATERRRRSTGGKQLA